MLIPHLSHHNELVQTGQTALSIAQKLGYISVVETLKVKLISLEYMMIGTDGLSQKRNAVKDLFVKLLASSAWFSCTF